MTIADSFFVPLEDTEHFDKDDATCPQFLVSKSRGFLPRQDPLAELPADFATLDSLLKRMTVLQPQDRNGDRSMGLLGTGDFGSAVLKELQPEGREVQAVRAAIAKGDSRLISALFRDYCFATSAYLLEPVDVAYRKTGRYAPGRNRLPAQLAVPLKLLADELGHFPFMEYASSYALMNYRVKDDDYKGFAGRYSFENLELIRAFQDADGSEKGFILVHVEMVSFSGQLVSATEAAMLAASQDDMPAFESHMRRMLETYRKIQVSMESMWKRSKPQDYLKLRSFIFGTGPKDTNPMFPEGVVYEGVDTKPMHFRGESGANDQLVPLGDNFLEITKHHPDNDLTKILREFREYRPATHRSYTASLEIRASEIGIRSLAMKTSPLSKALYILLVDQIREFRARHWRFAQAYIIKATKFPLATGGSEMARYLPNNLKTVLRVLDESISEWSQLDFDSLQSLGADETLLAEMVERVIRATDYQRQELAQEVSLLQEERRNDPDSGMLDAKAVRQLVV
ncbi:hypothetical protein FA10DRAFT_269995 [Acaromyces ingoldii]|uniref:Uncharacterized protein n=1 Tax=Acaromyces ingoldii TaxID=215250 RepID=A0A316YCF7_9BASI|nr:hypothetical protein FA10DRAFT_269995 [Acaromyces ingoldii]PWN86919.1 hypothetical protein FA10DRAFT_269995 [Acaromyces ingoldii]